MGAEHFQQLGRLIGSNSIGGSSIYLDRFIIGREMRKVGAHYKKITGIQIRLQCPGHLADHVRVMRAGDNGHNPEILLQMMLKKRKLNLQAVLLLVSRGMELKEIVFSDQLLNQRTIHLYFPQRGNIIPLRIKGGSLEALIMAGGQDEDVFKGSLRIDLMVGRSSYPGRILIAGMRCNDSRYFTLP